jgi:hypothetical protein
LAVVTNSNEGGSNWVRVVAAGSKQLTCPASPGHASCKSHSVSSLERIKRPLLRYRYGKGNPGRASAPQKRTVAVNVTGDPVTLPIVAVSLWIPIRLPRVHFAVAWPPASVWTIGSATWP